MTPVTEAESPNHESPFPTEPAVQQHDAVAESLRIRYRIRFAKIDLLRWISHRDLARLWERLLRRASLVLSMTEGFHPKPRVAFPSALALGVESRDEVVEIELAEDLSVDELLQRLRDDQQPGLVIHSVHRLPDGFGKAQLLSSEYTITIPESVDLNAAATSVKHLLDQPHIAFERKNKKITVSVPDQILRLELQGRELQLALSASETASLRPGDVLECLGAAHWIQQGALITRTKVQLMKEYETQDSSRVAFAKNDDDPLTNHSQTEHRNRPRPCNENHSDASSGPNTQRGEQT